MTHKPYTPGMTLNPGESTSVALPEPREGEFYVDHDVTFERVPPPATVRVDPQADELGLLPGLRAKKRDSPSRCSQCSQMQPPGSWLVWVPNGVRASDPAWSVIEACRMHAFNGMHSGWCLNCAKRLGGKSRLARAFAWGKARIG